MPMPLPSSRRVLQCLPVLFFVGFLLGLRVLAAGGDLAGLAVTLVFGLAAAASVAVLIVSTLASGPLVAQPLESSNGYGH